MERTKKEARENYNRLSNWYDLIAGSSEAECREIGVDLLNVKIGEKILEIGLGTGNSLLSIGALVGDHGSVFGVDLSDGMTRIANQKILRRHLSHRISLCLADGAFLPFRHNHFDAAFLSFTLELFDVEDIQRVLEECRRVLSQQGRLVNVSLSKSKSPGIIERIYEWFHGRMPITIDCRPININDFLLVSNFKILSQVEKTMWGIPVKITSASLMKR